MRYLLSIQQMRMLDSYMIDEIGIESAVLMERAAMSFAKHIINECNEKDKILAICGQGNNGGDGIAAARILSLKGFLVDVYLIEDKKHSASKGYQVQLAIAKKLGVNIVTDLKASEYTIIIDAIFGIGLSGDTDSCYKEIVESINQSGARVYAVDIPSGIDADNGQILKYAVKADITVTFGFMKRGMMLYPGADYSGRIYIEDIGYPQLKSSDVTDKNSHLQDIQHKSLRGFNSIDMCGERLISYYSEPADVKLAKRPADSNKGTFGRVLIIAGSSGMTGAVCLSAKAAYLVGAGLVRVLTSKEGVLAANRLIPEVMASSCYRSDETGRIIEPDYDKIREALKWATVVMCGPGMGKSEAAAMLLKEVVITVRVPLVLDADALNILAEGNKVSVDMLPTGTVLTPHIREFSRLTGCSVSEIKANMFDMIYKYAYNKKLVYVCKDARTVVTEGNRMYVNTTGNNGMSTGGSGDVLAGLIAGLIATGLTSFEAAADGVYIHGYAGDLATRKLSADSVMASDIAAGIPSVIKLIRDSGQ